MNNDSRQSVQTKHNPARYVRAKPILDDLRAQYKDGKITLQQFRTLRGQALSGDMDGAIKGLSKIMRI